MRQSLHRITIDTRGRGMIEFTDRVAAWIAAGAIDTGLLTVFCRHTSASLLIQENAAPAVRRDLEAWIARIAPESADDMPAHLRTVLTGVSLSVPVQGGAMLLGTWQGLYLFEHRRRPHRREVVLHLVGN